jgi:hypothetical protein
MLEEAGIFARVLSRRYDQLSQKNIKDRYQFAKDYRNWDIDHWNLIIFSDEADLLPTKCGKRYIRGKEMLPMPQDLAYTREIPRNLTIKVWGAISPLWVGTLVRYEGAITAEKYEEILE